MAKNNNLCKVLRLLRIANDYSVSYVSKKTQLSAPYIYEMERGEKTPTLSVIEKYAELFGIKSNTIMFFSDEADEKKLTTQKLLLKILETIVD